jgi:type IX secretion system PorP/SprF family membrane protein
MKTVLYILVWISTTFTVFAQQDAQFTQYMYNTINVNPAYAGSRGALSIFALHRNQWVGIDGAPVTNAIGINTPFNNQQIGLGLTILNDKIGPTVENIISTDVSYTIKTSPIYKLSFGIKATANLFSLNVSKLTPKQQGDKQFQNNTDSNFSPNFGAGIYFHSDKTYVGFSIPNFIESDRSFDANTAKIFKERMNYYLIAGKVIELSPLVKFKPSVLAKMVEGAPLQIDVSTNFSFNNQFTIGCAYRWSAALSFMVGFQLTDGLLVGYGYDLETTKLINYNSGSHEVFLRYEIFNNYNRITSPRFF